MYLLIVTRKTNVYGPGYGPREPGGYVPSTETIVLKPTNNTALELALSSLRSDDKYELFEAEPLVVIKHVSYAVKKI